jgi:hypothetical protein
MKVLNISNLGLYFEEYNFGKGSKISVHNMNEYSLLHLITQSFFVIIGLNELNFIFPFLTYALSGYNFRAFIKNPNFEKRFIVKAFV